MKINYNKTEALRAIGMTLLSGGDQTAIQLAKATTLPRADVLNLLRELELAGEVRSFGKHFRAVQLPIAGYNSPEEL